ncbi:brassinosteroid LRR receptor kinase BRL2-like [Rhododendron vialii]|uniref:brassinosteroid LRR receptor kinase BRL2-like n=1 Tax=Rhododendron vialii TaxID=182163 RepID=UPI00265E443D|nr:brassinosteroid LRR receptor kinase BRL2-like [Rhododendron vialii]
MASVPKNGPNFQAVHSRIIFVFVIILIPFVSSSDSAVARASPATQTVAKNSEAVALLMWKASLDNQSQSLLSSWNESSHCTWVGIGCNEASKVTNLNLDSIGLRGGREDQCKGGGRIHKLLSSHRGGKKWKWNQSSSGNTVSGETTTGDVEDQH